MIASHRPLSGGILLIALVVACRAAPTDVSPPLHAVVVAGDHQTAPPGSTLPTRLVLEVRDRESQPVPGLGVSWETTNEGALDAADAHTDDAGRAGARFTLGQSRGSMAVVAHVAGGPAVRFTVLSQLDPEGLPFDLPVALAFSTYDGSGQVVHPDHAATPGWGFEHGLAITPYPNGNPNFELPSLFASVNGDDWTTAPGVPNPVLAAPASGYYSDPDIVFLPETRELYLYYRQVTDRNLIYLVRSTDGVRWTAPELVIAAPNHEVISPAVVRRAPGDWWMWSVNGGLAGCGAATTELELRRSPDGHVWTQPTPVPLASGQLTPWHVDVQWLPTRRQFWALYNAKSAGGCTTPAVFLATSDDGIGWTPAPSPVLVKGQSRAFQDIVYRSTFEFRPATDEVIIWASGARYDDGRWTWSGAVVRRHRADLFARTAAAPTVFAPPPAELIDWP